MEFFEIIEATKIPFWENKYISGIKYKIIIDRCKKGQMKLATYNELIEMLGKDCASVDNFFIIMSSNAMERYNYLTNTISKVFYDELKTNEIFLNLLADGVQTNTKETIFDNVSSRKSIDEKSSRTLKALFGKISMIFNRTAKSSESMIMEKTSIYEYPLRNSSGIKLIYAQKVFEVLLEIYKLNSYIEMNRSAVTVISDYADASFLTKAFHENQKKISTNYKFFCDSTILFTCREMQNLYHIHSFLTGGTLINSKNAFLEFYDQHIYFEKSRIKKDTKSKKLYGERGFEIIHKFPSLQNSFKLLFYPYVKLVLFIIIICVLLNVHIFHDAMQTRGMALLTGCTFLWVTEAIELWITAIFIPFLTVLFNVLKSEDGLPLTAEESSQVVFQSMFSSMIMVLLGGFSISQALEKYEVTRLIAQYIICFCGNNPRRLLLGIMLLACFLSMWISNIAAPVLCFSLIKPILDILPEGSSSSKAFVLGIAFASNIGGMSSPIASPQNIITLDILGEQQPNWGIWYLIALPICIMSLISIWILLAYSLNFKHTIPANEKSKKNNISKTQIFICLTSLLTIGLWCVLTQTKQFFGSAGIVACIPIIILFGLQILTLEDLKEFHWNIIFLAMGANVLGLAIKSCGLLETIGIYLIDKLQDIPIYGILLILSVVMAIFATFVSHTVSVIVMAPLIKQVGDSMNPKRSSILLITTALLASGAMALPTSGFPNITAIGLLDSKGNRYVHQSTFIKYGVPATLISLCFIVSLGYGIMIALGY